MGRWTSFGPGDEKKLHGTLSYKPNDEWNNTVAPMMLNNESFVQRNAE